MILMGTQQQELGGYTYRHYHDEGDFYIYKQGDVSDNRDDEEDDEEDDDRKTSKGELEEVMTRY